MTCPWNHGRISYQHSGGMLYEALQVLTLMFALLLLLQSSVLAANTDTTVTVTLPTFAVALNDTKIDSAHSEYPLIVYRDITSVSYTYLDMPARFMCHI